MHGLLNAWLSACSGQKIFLLRHGEIQKHTDGKRFIGQTDLSLNDTGTRQAQWWRQCLINVPLGRILSSDLDRCMETARIIATDHAATVEALAGLREIHLGEWEGQSFRRVKERWPDAFRERGMNFARFRPPGGESFLDLQQRVLTIFEKAIEQSDAHLLIVAHAGVNRAILCHLLGIPMDNLFRMAQGCGAMNLINRQGCNYRIQLLNLLPDPEASVSNTR